VGNMKNWSIKGRFDKIQLPVMLINGRYDEAVDEVVQPWFDGLKKVRWFTFAESSHTPHWEERDLFMEKVAGFLKS
jgi:pimeloyl-ACP methyl ester carboxylesterase